MSTYFRRGESELGCTLCWVLPIDKELDAIVVPFPMAKNGIHVHFVIYMQENEKF